MLIENAFSPAEFELAGKKDGRDTLLALSEQIAREISTHMVRKVEEFIGRLVISVDSSTMFDKERVIMLFRLGGKIEMNKTSGYPSEFLPGLEMDRSSESRDLHFG